MDLPIQTRVEWKSTTTGMLSTVMNVQGEHMGVVQKSFHFFQAFRRTFAKLSQAFARGVLPLSAKMVFRSG